jgi:23S rRNA (cytosine1962-C5)-methyltransferase
MHRHLEWILRGLEVQFPGAPVIVRADHRSEKHEGIKMDGPPPPESLREIVIKEGPAQFRVDLRKGHKTGFFLDQRDNRARVAELCKGHEFFDGFCYSGGFAVMAALSGAKRVEAVDLDENAIAMANKNKKQNNLGESLEFRHGDVFNVLRDHRTAGKRFARMILDPAKQAVSRPELPKAAAAYQDMNRLGMQCVEPGGMLVSCSCTGLLQEEDFIDVLRAAAVQAGVELQIFHISGAPGDHPVAGFVPEGRYLKAVFSRVWPVRR